jgi:GNAT superfamily N-acetyltransferase
MLHDRSEFEHILGEPAYAFFVAYQAGEPVAYIEIGPASQDACTVIRDEKTCSITGAYTRPGARNSGVAAALLNRCLSWAQSQGYQRCAVDFEPMNFLARRFWLKYFQPVSYTLIRQVDERIRFAIPPSPLQKNL